MNGDQWFESEHFRMKIYLFVFLFGLCTCTHSQTFKFTPASFSVSYKSLQKGKYSIEVPEVQELVHIIFAITDKGIADLDMVDHETAYYKEVMAHFGLFKEEAIVKTIGKKLTGNIFMSGPGAYARLKMDACGFYFSNDKILKDSTYSHLNWDNKNHIDEYIPQIEAFAQKTQFRAFFERHQTYYRSLIEQANRQLEIEKQWQWLEQRFDQRYHHYRITFSPLVNGNHSTNRFADDDFWQTVMFICSPFDNPKLNPKVLDGLMVRIVLTEIDHNYVNPVTDSYLQEINRIFNDRQKWTSGSVAKSYDSPYLVFNEYMTYAVFTLYAYDHFDPAVFEEINRRTEIQMTKNRGFVKYQAFNQKVLELYKTQNHKAIQELYPSILEWCKNQ